MQVRAEEVVVASLADPELLLSLGLPSHGHPRRNKSDPGPYSSAASLARRRTTETGRRTLAYEEFASSGSVYPMRMARVNVYLSDDLAAQVRDADVNVSAVTQEALRRELDSRRTDAWLDEVAHLKQIDLPREVVETALDAGRDEFGRPSE